MPRTTSSSVRILGFLFLWRLSTLKLVVLFGARNPENTSLEKIKKMREIHVGAVKDHDLTCLHAGSDLPGALGVCVLGGVDENEIRKETLKIESHMALGCGLAATVFCPIHTRSHEFNGGGIHQMDDLAEAVCDTLAQLALPESWRKEF